ncbi:MAG: bifunctional metallophosphatase/5'-nucleotidase [Candidatus Binatia bacterium]
MGTWLLVALLLLLSGSLSVAEEKLAILHTSEHHGALQPIEQGSFAGFGGVARRAALIQRIRKEVKHVLVVDSGDLVVGTAMSSVFRGAPDIAAMNLMGYDALGLGNHDFDFGLEHLSNLKKQARFPFLCTNLRPKKTGLCQPFAVKSVGRLRVGLLGIVGRRSYPEMFSREAVRDIKFGEPIAAVRSALQQLSGRVDLIVAITHQETEEDLALAKAVPEIGVIVGGHTAGFDGLIAGGGSAPVQGRIDPLPPGPIFVKTHQQGRTLGRLDLVLDKKPRAAEARNLPVEQALPEQPKLAALVQDYARRLDAAASHVLGQALVDLTGESPVVRTRETNFGNFLADLARSRLGTETALLNSGLIRNTIPAGPVTLKQIMQALPYEEPLISFRLTGAELREALENSVAMLPATSGRFLQVSGLNYAFDPAAPPGARVKEVRVQNILLARDRDYSVAVNRFLAEGGDGYAVFLKARDKVEHQSPLRDLFSAALKSAPVTASEEGRIKAVEVKR